MTDKKLFVAVAALLAALAWRAPQSHAATGTPSVVVSSVSFAGVPMLAPPASGTVYKIKSIRVCNDTSNATCVFFTDDYATGSITAGGINKANLVMPLCAAAQTCQDAPHDAAGGQTWSESNGGLANLLGMQLTAKNGFMVYSGSATASGILGVTAVISYGIQSLR